MKRPVLANLEIGRRPTVSLVELLVLGKVLGVPPLLLIFPVGREEMTEVLPGREIPTWQAAKWFTGEEAFPTRASDEWVVSHEDHAAWEKGGEPLDRFRWNDRYFADLRGARGRATGQRKAAETAKTDAERDAMLSAAKAEDHLAKQIEANIRRNRQGMREAGLTPGKLRPESAHIDPEGDE